MEVHPLHDNNSSLHKNTIQREGKNMTNDIKNAVRLWSYLVLFFPLCLGLQNILFYLDKKDWMQHTTRQCPVQVFMCLVICMNTHINLNKECYIVHKNEKYEI